MVDKLSI